MNPHWHLIIEVDPFIETTTRAQRTERPPQIGEKHWMKQVRQGSFDCQSVKSNGVIEYITKMSTEETHFDKFVVFREFLNI